MKLLLTIVLCISAICLQAQDGRDIIYLKDGSIYKGNITEYIPGAHATIKLLDDRIIVVPAPGIMHMTMGRDDIIKKNFDMKQKGYFHNSLVGPQWGKSNYGSTQVTFAYNMVNGYRIKNHHMGIGLGAEKHSGNWYAPVYADYSYHILKGHFSPVVGINGGFMAPFRDESGSEYGYTEGSFVGGRIGFVAYKNPHFAFLLNITYRHIRLSGAEYNRFTSWDQWHEVTGSASLHRVGIMMGIVIN